MKIVTSINNVMKIAKSLEKSDLWIKGMTQTFENETKEQRGRFFGVKIGTFRANLLGNILASVFRVDKGTIRARKITMKMKAGHVFLCCFML